MDVVKLTLGNQFRIYSFLLLLFCFAGCWSGSNPEARFEFTQPQMGVPFRLVLYAPSEAHARDAAARAFRRISELNDILSDYDTDSELNRLCRTAGENRAVQVSHDLWNVLFRSHEIARQSNGAFDITVRPVVSLWRNARREKKLPDARRLAEARSLVGRTNVVLDPSRRTVKLLVPDMRLDLGGIAKGYAVDEALKILQACGVKRALVAGAGDLAASGAPPGQEGWRVEIAPLDAPNAPKSRFASLAHAALATSGDLFQHLEIDGKRYSHIVDPRTGLGLTDHSLVTVIAKDCTTADALATAVSVLGPQKGIALIQRFPSAEAYIVSQPGARIEVAETQGFSRFLQE